MSFNYSLRRYMIFQFPIYVIHPTKKMFSLYRAFEWYQNVSMYHGGIQVQKQDSDMLFLFNVVIKDSTEV